MEQKCLQATFRGSKNISRKYTEYRFQLGPINSKQEMMSPILNVKSRLTRSTNMWVKIMRLQGGTL